MRRLPAVGIASALAANRSASCGGCKGVPVSAMQRLLMQRPVVAGIAGTGMALGSPGMESPVGAAPYSVFSFTGHGACRPFQRIEV
jgi:hypothetical protein